MIEKSYDIVVVGSGAGGGTVAYGAIINHTGPGMRARDEGCLEHGGHGARACRTGQKVSFSSHKSREGCADEMEGRIGCGCRSCCDACIGGRHPHRKCDGLARDMFAGLVLFDEDPMIDIDNARSISAVINRDALALAGEISP